MSDLYDDARPVRDAAVAEIERLIAGEPVAPDTRAANILAVHLTAVMMAFVARRHDRSGGAPVQDPGFHGLVAAAVGSLICNISMGFRPIIDGRPMQPVDVAHHLLGLVALHAMSQTATSQAGCEDFVIPVRKDEHGDLKPVPFDVLDLLKGKP